MSAYLLSFFDIETALPPLFISPFMKFNIKYAGQEHLVFIHILPSCVSINTFMVFIMWLSLFTDTHTTY